MKSCSIEVHSRTYHFLTTGAAELPTVLWLHGFTGSATTFEKTAANFPAYRHVLLDLAGHGGSSATDCNFKEQLSDIVALMSYIGTEQFEIVGYSMGGRIAIGLACDYPEKVTQLIIESSSPGLATAMQQKERRASDHHLIQRLESEGIESFMTFWQDIPLFASQKDLPLEVRQQLWQQRQRNTVAGLVRSLKGMGTGAQPSYWEKLSVIQCPVTLIVGQRDEKYVALAAEMQVKQPQFSVEIVENVGHAIHIENNTYFATMLKKWL